MSKHTPEPWVMSTKASGNWWHISAGNQAIAAVHAASKKRNEPYASMFEANARRIVACVNACAGVDTDLLEAGELDKPTMLVIQENKDLKHRCDELLAALDEISKLPSYRQDECSEMARDAIAKANGGAS